MSVEGFQTVDTGIIDTSFIERCFLKIYHQQATNVKDSDQKIECIFGDTINYHQGRNAYFNYEMTTAKDVANAAAIVLVDGDAFRLVNNAFEFCFTETCLSST